MRGREGVPTGIGIRKLWSPRRNRGGGGKGTVGERSETGLVGWWPSEGEEGKQPAGS